MIEYCLLCGLTGFVVIGLLTQPYEVFEKWREFVYRLVKIQFTEPVSYSLDELFFLQLAIYKPLAGCGKCFAGWFSIVVYLNSFHFELFPFIFFVVGAIFTAWIINMLSFKFFKDFI